MTRGCVLFAGAGRGCPMFTITLPWHSQALLCAMIFLAGFVDASAGGGGLISLPAYLASGLPAHLAFGCNKFSSACGTTLAAARYFKRGAMDGQVALLASAASFVGSGAATHLLLLLPETFLKRMLLVLVPVAAAFLLLRRPAAAPRAMALRHGRRAALALVIGLLIGGYDGLVGPGTGTFAILAFSGLMGYDLRTAGGNAKLLNLASNYASLAACLAAGQVALRVAGPCAVCGVAGSWLGSGLALKRGARFIRPMLVGVLCLLVGKLTLDVLL